MTDTQKTIIENLNSSLTEFHTLRLGYISKDGTESERIVTVHEMHDTYAVVATGKGFRSFTLDNIIYADKSYAN